MIGIDIELPQGEELLRYDGGGVEGDEVECYIGKKRDRIVNKSDFNGKKSGVVM